MRGNQVMGMMYGMSEISWERTDHIGTDRITCQLQMKRWCEISNK